MAIAVVAALVGASAGPPSAGAQDESTTTSPTTVTTVPLPTIPGSTTTQPDGAASTTTTTIDPDDPTSTEDAPPETVPDVDATVPAGAVGAPRASLVRLDAGAAAAAVAASADTVATAAREVEDLSVRLAELEADLARIDASLRRVVDDLRVAEDIFEDRVAGAVVRGNAAELETLVAVSDIIELRTADVLLTSVTQSDVDAIAAYVAARAVLDRGLLLVVDAVTETRRRLRAARAAHRDALAEDVRVRYRHAVIAAGSDIVIDGFVFPVGEPFTFIDSWGYPRMVGTEYEHGHQGVDIMAPFGTPLYAAERGVVTRVGTDTLGGTKLWLRGESGTDYYYAHLQRYEDGIAPGVVVEGGDVLGYVGDTGNARGGAPHLHFQLHPGGGAPVNPYALLRTVADL